MLKILQVGVGPLGHRILNELIERGIGEVVGAIDPAPALAGTPLSRHVIGAPSDLTILPHLSDFQRFADVNCAVVTTSSDLRHCEPTFHDLLSRGMNVVSTCEELVWPWLHHDLLARRLHEVARASGGRLLGTGVNPGFLMDTLPVVLSAVCTRVRSVQVARIQDASSRRVPFQKKIGAGLTPDQFDQRVREKTLRHVGLGESLHFIAACTGLTIERWQEEIEPVIADRELSCALGSIHRGTVAGVRQVARGFADEREVVHLEFQAAIAQKDPHDRVRLEADPPIDCILNGGVHGDAATCAITLNAIPRLLESLPGLHTMSTIAPVRVVQPSRR